MAVSFNGCSISVATTGGGTPTIFGLRSLTFGGGNVAAIDMTSANSGRRLQLPGLREPYSITIDAIAPITTSQPAIGSFVDWTISGNTTMTTSGTAWYVESSEVTGSIDEVNTITIVLIEGSGAS